jgi:hypothetical protein
MVVKIARFSSEVNLQTTEHTMIYPGSDPSSNVIAYVQWFDLKNEQRLQWGEQRA